MYHCIKEAIWGEKTGKLDYGKPPKRGVLYKKGDQSVLGPREDLEG